MGLEKYHTSVELPLTLTELKNNYSSKSVFISGGTLLQLNWEAGMERPVQLISTEKITALKKLEEVIIQDKKYLKIGAGTTIADCCYHTKIKQYAPILAEACKKIAAPAVRNRGTIGGNICSKIGDSIPALLVLDAKLLFFNGEKEYILSINEWLSSSKRNPFELLIHVLIPIEDKEKKSSYFFEKIGRRESFTAAIISIAGYIEKNAKTYETVRLAIGGGAHLPTRIEKGEILLQNQSLSNVDWPSFHQAIENGFSSYTDPFVTEKYRRKVAANIFLGSIQTCLENKTNE
jgi:xanthine dehydrogenase C subunit